MPFFRSTSQIQSPPSAPPLSGFWGEKMSAAYPLLSRNKKLRTHVTYVTTTALLDFYGEELEATGCFLLVPPNKFLVQES